MAWTLFSSSSTYSVPIQSAMINKNSTNSFPFNPNHFRITKSKSTRRGRLIRNASSSSEEKEKEDDTPAFNPFSFVTDNPSSRSAIQLPETPAEDGNVGQMLYRIEDKGKEYGSYIRSGKFVWFVRETGSPESQRGTVVFLHGAPTQSYSYRVVMSQMADYGFHCLAPDWIGFGFSDKPQPGYGFNYTEKEYHEELDRLLDVLEVKSPFFLVVQGFLVGTYGLTWALKNPSRISALAILNSPLTASSPIPGLFQKLKIPLYGEFTCQNAIMAERFIEAGSPYVLKSEKADVYRLPYLSSGGPGFALLEAARKANFQDLSRQIAAGFASGGWDKPVLAVWGIEDKYLRQSEAEEFQKGNPDNVKIKLVEGAGHMPQEDWPEKVFDALRVFF
ncbi:Alpha/beta hydrolase fold-1 [Dillenia turbinata]|uniref:Alpha/beta hydrolase fold-1 n=1 Tax=Dillenia turbinata TaxID=194707 RepID=A0AAN8UR12_9MAGN